MTSDIVVVTTPLARPVDVARRASSAEPSARYTPAPSADQVARGEATIGRGAAGASVEVVQARLNAAGASPALREDGLFGPKTEAALVGFQRAKGLAPSGRVDAPTLAALERAAPAPGDTFARGGELGARVGPDAGGPRAPHVDDAPAADTVRAGELARADQARRREADPTRLALPPRPVGAETGSAFLARTAGMSRPEREAAIREEILRGNVPDFLRQLQPVDVERTGADGARHRLRYHALPDYLAIGSDQDFVRIPMSPTTAQAIADATGTQLPTRRMVGQIYAAADVQLTPQPLPAGPRMMSNEYYREHQARVEAQRARLGAPLGALTAGDKKDIVATNRLDAHPDRVAIYGWHQPGGRPIQGLSTVHEASYADYSHGARLIAGEVMVDGRPRRIADVLADPNLAPLLSDEGVLRDPRVVRR
jgi:peptidoglycan hydrolase-like protein with peptidoglycan-binding domain